MRRRLALVSMAATSMVVIAFVIPLGLLVRSEAERRALNSAEQDAQSVATALAVAGVLESGVDADLARSVVAASRAMDDVSVFLADGAVVGVDAERTDNITRAALGFAFTARIDGGAEVLVPVTGPAGSIVVRAFVTDEELREGVVYAWVVLAALATVLIGVALLVADRLARSVVRPIRELADSARRLGGGDLDARVTPLGPAEVADVGIAFNQLAARLHVLLADERESVADLSHRLRTPLTALRLQAERVKDEASRAELVADVDRLERDIDLLIEDARRAVGGDTAASSDLAETTAHRLDFWSVLAEEQRRPVSRALGDQPEPVALGEGEVGAVVDTLLENVFAHTPPGTGFSVSVSSRDEHALLVVSDEGPGFGDEALLGRGESGSGSTGLGLDIVRRLAERSRGGIEVSESATGGLRVEVRFGRPSGDGG